MANRRARTRPFAHNNRWTWIRFTWMLECCVLWRQSALPFVRCCNRQLLILHPTPNRSSNNTVPCIDDAVNNLSTKNSMWSRARDKQIRLEQTKNVTLETWSWHFVTRYIVFVSQDCVCSSRGAWTRKNLNCEKKTQADSQNVDSEPQKNVTFRNDFGCSFHLLSNRGSQP